MVSFQIPGRGGAGSRSYGRVPLRAPAGVAEQQREQCCSGNAGNFEPLPPPYLPAAMNSAPGAGANATPPQPQSLHRRRVADDAPGRRLVRPFTPFMLGDFVGFVTNQFSDMKIAEGESPQPLDRVFYRFNWYNNVAPAQWTGLPTATIHDVNLYRNVLGFEKTLFDGNYLARPASRSTLSKPKPSPMWSASKVSIRRSLATSMPSSRRCCGRTAKTGDLISAGVTLSLPTVSSLLTNPSQSIVLYVQPYGAFIYNRGDLFFQGFMSITAPIFHRPSPSCCSPTSASATGGTATRRGPTPDGLRSHSL